VQGSLGDDSALTLMPDHGSLWRYRKFAPAFDTICQSEGVEIMRTPYRAPDANAVAERWIRSVRQECLDHLLILGEALCRLVY
jgi:hypothetical protein